MPNIDFFVMSKVGVDGLQVNWNCRTCSRDYLQLQPRTFTYMTCITIYLGIIITSYLFGSISNKNTFQLKANRGLALPPPPLLHEHLGPPLQHGDLSTLHGNGFQALEWKNVNFVKHEIMTFYLCTKMVLFSGGSRRARDAFALSPCFFYPWGRVWVHHLSLSSGHRRNGILRWPSSPIPWFS